jgi:hypothetical protein
MRIITSVKRHTCTNRHMIYRQVDILFVCNYLYTNKLLIIVDIVQKRKNLVQFFNMNNEIKENAREEHLCRRPVEKLTDMRNVERERM